MMDELYVAGKAMKDLEILPAVRYPDIHMLGKGECLLFGIDNKKQFKSLRLLSKEDASSCWKHSKGNHHSFPAVRVMIPLLTEGESRKIDPEAWKRMDFNNKVLQLRSLNFESLNFREQVYLSDWSYQQLGPILECDDLETAALRQLIRCFPQKPQCRDFLKQMLSFLQEYLGTCTDEKAMDLIKDLLTGVWDSKKRCYVSHCMTYYDVYETGQFENSVFSSATARKLSEFLFRKESQNSNHEELISDPLSGRRDWGVGDKYPNPTIPVVGPTYLYSRNKNIPCLTRYGMSDTKAFQAGRSSVQLAQNALMALTKADRENLTWKKISSGRRKGADLLLAYASQMPENQAFLAQILGAPQTYSSINMDEVRYENQKDVFDDLCGQVLGALRSIQGIPSEEERNQIHMIILGTLDTGKKQIVYGNSLTVNQLCENLISWEKASHNCPVIKIPLLAKKRRNLYTPRCPGPDEICRLLKINCTWHRIMHPLNQSSISLSEIYQIYMPRRGAESLDPVFIRKVLLKSFNTVKYLMSMASAEITINNGIVSGSALFKQIDYVGYAVSFLSILLGYLHIRKEQYMENAPYNVGQLFKLADQLHKNYCVAVRNGGDKKKRLPPQLLGNAIFPIACVHPVEGLNRLRERIRPYIAWAETVSNEENSSFVRHILKEMANKAQYIAAHELPKEFSPEEQAQVFLGYLAEVNQKKEDN
jgi:hypothetical protein